MRVGFVGCGKLGLPVALAAESKGHDVRGYDIDTRIAGYLAGVPYPHREQGMAALLSDTKMTMAPLGGLCQWADILFLAIQTPHDPRFEGDRPLPNDRADFNYDHLKACVAAVDSHLVRPTVCVIISTVLPGTIDREIRPLMSENFKLVYEPLFIAMGTVVHDFLRPEFVLAAADTAWALRGLQEFYKLIHDQPIFLTDIRTAEGIKVFYNTFITAKTVLANLYGEMAELFGMNVDDIFKALSLGTDRLLSPKYLQAGMGDGGGCHPRDNIALSWLARQSEMSFDFFSALMQAREAHTNWMASLIDRHRGELPVFLLGRSFKPETDIETGSPAVLLSRILQVRGIAHESGDHIVPHVPGLYFIATRHPWFARYHFPAGSVVIDPFRYVPTQQDGVQVIRIGDGSRNAASELSAVAETREVSVE